MPQVHLRSWVSSFTLSFASTLAPWKLRKKKISWVVSMTWAPEYLAWRLATSLSATSTVVKTVGNAAASIWDHDVGRSISNFGSCQFKILRKSSWYPTEDEAPNSSRPTTLWNQTPTVQQVTNWTNSGPGNQTMFTFGGLYELLVLAMPISS